MTKDDNFKSMDFCQKLTTLIPETQTLLVKEILDKIKKCGTTISVCAHNLLVLSDKPTSVDALLLEWTKIRYKHLFKRTTN